MHKPLPFKTPQVFRTSMSEISFILDYAGWSLSYFSKQLTFGDVCWRIRKKRSPQPALVEKNAPPLWILSPPGTIICNIYIENMNMKGDKAKRTWILDTCHTLTSLCVSPSHKSNKNVIHLPLYIKSKMQYFMTILNSRFYAISKLQNLTFLGWLFSVSLWWRK